MNCIPVSGGGLERVSASAPLAAAIPSPAISASVVLVVGAHLDGRPHPVHPGSGLLFSGVVIFHSNKFIHLFARFYR